MYRLEKRPVAVAAASLLLAVPIVPAELWLVKTIVDRVEAWTAPEPVGGIVAAAAALALLMAVGNIALGVPAPMAMTRLIEIGSLEERRLLLDKTARLPLASVESPAVQRLRERAGRVSLYDTFNAGLQLAQLTLRSALLLALLLGYGQWLPAAAVCAAAALHAAVSGRASERMERLAREQTEDGRLLRHYADLMTKRGAAAEVRLFGLGGTLAERWGALYGKLSRERWRAVRSAGLRKLGPDLLLASLAGPLLVAVVLQPGADRLTAGDFALLLMALTLLMGQLPEWIAQAAAMRALAMRWDDFRAYMALEEAEGGPSPRTGPDAAPAAVGLQARGLRFRYPGAERDAIDGVGLTIPPGCRAALVGENGSGKSTLVKLLTGLYAPDEGVVAWTDGEARRLAGAGEAGVSAVFQDFTRLCLTLRGNVVLGSAAMAAASAPAERVDAALREALRDAGSGLRDLDAQLGAAFGGIEPSGGEWQKLATARALLRDAGFVFFDEPTAALDPVAEKEAFALFLRVTEGRSALLVTHRLGAAKLADVIYVLKDGKLIESGTHDELLMRPGGEYGRMFRTQAAWYA
ncbi:hypothetical protein DLM86_15595 [Paenibacillus flagellatus]|uniref:ABC transporter domain-containing protein n=1 Tax=Paenibacillus flagellatus TaxID=2211139 RepID=A0A2V5K5M6_9BACL|nr:hypothetical protein DLM86_15595 [Paenibacillus flagellatus]